MASVAPCALFDPHALPHKRGKSCPCASQAVQKHNSSLVFTRYCSGRNGVRLTIAKTAARESIEFAQSAYQIDLLPFAEPIEIQETPNVELEKEGMEMKRRIEIIRSMFRSQGDGEISVSPYDTAWVARVSALDGSGEPQFPSCLQWIIENQLADGSWGDSRHFHVGDRIINTLSCVIALKTWNVANDAVNKGLRFLQRYILKINAKDDVESLIGFEIIFPSLMEDAKAMNLDLPYDDNILQVVYAERDLKMKRIPMDVLHNSPSTLLHSLEGLRDVVDWDKLQKFQSKDGSYLFSTASTAYALIQTSDINCARYLAKTIKIHNGGVPITYPVDIFEHLWMVDRLERLGIARYFEKEITNNLDYVYRYWTNKGVGWARDSSVQDVDDTSMAFRLLRLHGFNVSSEVFSHFKQGDQFICFKGQVSQAVTGIYNLYRASQIMFPGESILQEAKLFSKNFLQDKRAKNQINDKWIISQGLASEVGYALDFPWHASQPRIETRMYIEQYGTDDIWIGKSLYRMPFVNNATYIDLAREDFKFCQSIHRKELDVIIRWSSENRFHELGLERPSIIRLYFLSAVALFEPEMAASRIAWAHSSILMTAVRNLFSGWHSSPHKKCHFVNVFQRWDVTGLNEDIPQSATRLLTCLFQTIKMLSLDGSVAQGWNLFHICCRWSSENRFHELGLERHSIIRLYFLSAVALFEPEMAASRIAWAHSSILMTAVRNLFSGWHSSPHKKCHFVNVFQRWDVTGLNEDIPQSATRLLTCLFQTIKMLSLDGSVAQGWNLFHICCRWSSENRFHELGLERHSIIRLYFLSAVALFEPEMAASRIAWAHSSILMTAVRNLFSGWHSSPHKKCHFVNVFQRWDVTGLNEDIPQSATRLLTCLFQTIKMLSLDGSVAQGWNIRDALINAWQTWLAKEAGKGEEGMEANIIPDAEVIVMSASFFDTEVIYPDSICRPEFIQMIKLTNTICSLMRVATHLKEKRTCERNVWVPVEEEKLKRIKQRADEAMRELVRKVHDGRRGVPSMVKRLCMSVSKSFYYTTHCTNKEMDDHVDLVLFKPVE